MLEVLEAASKLRPTSGYQDIKQDTEELDAVVDFKARQVEKCSKKIKI